LVEDFVIGAGITDPRVIDSVRQTKRHEFVSTGKRRFAYDDMSLPIGHNQTISSPFIVAFMTESLDPQPDDRVLEIGTGSGYQAAILSPLVKDVYSIEIVEPLGKKAIKTLRRLGYENVHVRIGDGFKGWPEEAPFDKIIVTCSPEDVPQPLIDQLREGGRMIIPVGERFEQTLYLFTKQDGELQQEALRPTLFVPMTGEAEARRQIQPDGTRPTLSNGSFEENPQGKLPLEGWYYQRELERIVGEDAKDGNAFVRFSNDVAGRTSRALQGFPVDGRERSELIVNAWVRLRRVEYGPEPHMTPKLAVTFFDENRAALATRWIGPWQGSSAWQPVEARMRIPKSAREAILRVGLFGATGTLDVDDVRVRAGN
ncbi:MAG: protein-L-isoaspartate(D-aspartate) O-methyltransferase, partial [Planctomycetota bacterium]